MRTSIIIRTIFLTLLVIFSFETLEAQLKVHSNGLFNLKLDANVVVHDDDDGDVNIIGSITFDSGAELSLASDWNNDGSFAAGTGTVTFDGGALQNIAGAVSSEFYDLHVNKGGGNVELAIETRVENYMRLLSDSPSLF